MTYTAIGLLLSAFFALGLLQLLHHLLWQYEWQAWRIARGSGSLAELFHNLRYEGHPALWYLLLFALSRLTPHQLRQFPGSIVPAEVHYLYLLKSAQEP